MTIVARLNRCQLPVMSLRGDEIVALHSLKQLYAEQRRQVIRASALKLSKDVRESSC